MTEKEERNKQVERVANELYDWSGRYGGNDCLWKDLPDDDKDEFLKEATFLTDEFYIRMTYTDTLPCGCMIVWSDEENKGMINYCQTHTSSINSKRLAEEYDRGYKEGYEVGYWDGMDAEQYEHSGVPGR